MHSYISLLKRNPTLLTLSLVQLICYFGAWFSHTAIYSLVVDLGASDIALASVAAFAFSATMFTAPFAGVIIDKLSTKPLMLALLAFESISVLMLLFVNSLDMLWFLFVLIFIRMGAGSTYFQTEMSLLPKILSNNDLKLANEIHSIIWSLSYTAGMGLAGIYVYFFGTSSAFIADSILFLIGFILLLKLKLPSLVKEKTKKVFTMLKDGFSYLVRHKKIVHLILLHACVGFTSYDSLVALLAKNQYNTVLAVPLTIGFINSIRALSLTFGSVLLSKYVNEKTLHVIFFMQGIGIVLWGILQFNFYLSIVGILIAGFFTSTLWAYTFTLLQRETDSKYYGRIIAYNDMAIMGVSTVISLLIGFMYEAGLPLWGVTIFLGLLFFISGFYWLWFKKNHI